MELNPLSGVAEVRRSYALRFGAALFVVLLVVGVFGGGIYAHTGSELEADVEEQLVADTETDADRLETWFASTERYVESIARSSTFRNDDQFTISGSLHRTADRPAFEGAYYVDTETGVVDARAGTDEVLEDGRVSPVVDDRLSSATDGTPEVVFSEPFETRAGRPVILAVSEVPGDSDRAVVGLVDLESLSEYMIGSDDADGVAGNVTVVDRSGTVVLAEERSQLLETLAHESDMRADESGMMTVDPDEESSMATVDSDDEEFVVGYAPVENANGGWTLTTRVPTSEAYSLQSDVSLQILAMLGVVFASVLLLGATVGRNTARSLRDLSERAAAIEAGNLDEPVDSDRSDELGDLYRSIDRMRRSLRDRLEETERARTEAERARAESERFSRHLERTADEYGETMRACANGDLTRRLEPDEESEAMATVAAEFNAMMDDLEATVAATRAFAEAVTDAADSTAEGVVEVRSASQQVTTSIQQISDGADRQSDQLAAVSDEVGELSTTTEEIADNAAEVATLAQRTARTSGNARESARQAIEGMNAIEAEASAAVAEVERLEEEIRAIDDLLEFIGTVTDETNMLALNASIEAARSSADGGEFAAVADQVKSLAEDTREAATEIEDRLERVTEQTAAVATVVRETDERIADHRSGIETAVAALEEIDDYAAATNDGVQEISAATQQQAAATQEVVSMTDDVTAISEETSAEAETVAAAAEEQTASLGEVSETATSLSDRARELSDALGSFEVAAEPTPGLGPSDPDVESESASSSNRDPSIGDESDEPSSADDEEFAWSEP